MAVYDMVAAGHRVVFERDADGQDQSHAVHIATGRKVRFTPRQRTWDLDVEIVPARDVVEASKSIKTFQQKQADALCTLEGCTNCGKPDERPRLCPFGRRAKP